MYSSLLHADREDFEWTARARRQSDLNDNHVGHTVARLNKFAVLLDSWRFLVITGRRHLLASHFLISSSSSKFCFSYRKTFLYVCTLENTKQNPDSVHKIMYNLTQRHICDIQPSWLNMPVLVNRINTKIYNYVLFNSLNQHKNRLFPCF